MFEVGIDIVEIERIKKSMTNKGFLHRILGKNEYKQLEARQFPVQSVAGSFCAKEAFSKAVGTGFRGIKLREIQIIRDNLDKPHILLSGKTSHLYSDKDNYFSVSISHTNDLATAIVLYQKRNIIK